MLQSQQGLFFLLTLKYLHIQHLISNIPSLYYTLILPHILIIVNYLFYILVLYRGYYPLFYLTR
nr:MAG TPA: hypothetical protein [Caudoviricetes sp.]